MDEISPENRKKMLTRADEIRPRIAAEVSTEKGWTTVKMYEENPDRRISRARSWTGTERQLSASSHRQ
jgi:hypothetical protein